MRGAVLSVAVRACLLGSALLQRAGRRTRRRPSTTGVRARRRARLVRDRSRVGLRPAGRRDPRARCNRRARGGQRLPVQSLRLGHRAAPRSLAQRGHRGTHASPGAARRDARGADAGGAAANPRAARLAWGDRAGRRARRLVRGVPALRPTAGAHRGECRSLPVCRGLRARLPRTLR